MTRSSSILGALVAWLAFAGVAVNAQEANPALRHPTGADAPEGRVLVKFRDPGTTGRAQAQAATDRVAALATRTGIRFRRARALGLKWHVVELDPTASVPEQLVRILADDSVEYATLDRRRYPHARAERSVIYESVVSPGQRHDALSINAEQAWSTQHGQRRRRDCRSRHRRALRPSGSRPRRRRRAAAAGLRLHHRCARGQRRRRSGCRPHRHRRFSDYAAKRRRTSSRIAVAAAAIARGTARARPGSSALAPITLEGIAGTTWSPWIVPVRVLGKCGGFDSDILDGDAVGGRHSRGRGARQPVSGADRESEPGRQRRVQLSSTRT